MAEIPGLQPGEAGFQTRLAEIEGFRGVCEYGGKQPVVLCYQALLGSLSPHRALAAPHLARFSRDLGYAGLPLA
jgi:hypothetical protein